MWGALGLGGHPHPPASLRAMSLAVSCPVSTPAPADVSTPLPKARADVIFQLVPDGAVLLSTRDEIYYGLNEVGAEIWTLLVGAPLSVELLCSALGARYPEVPQAELRVDVLELLADLAQAGLVERHRAAA
jgi:hypothetical protein